MKTLYPPQQKALEFFVGTHQANRNTLDSSMVGTGKTVVGCHLVQALDRPVGVVCPKSVLASWRRELEAHGVQPLFVLNYEKIRNGRTPWLTKTGKKAMRWQVPPDTLLIFDEVHKCLPEGTKVAAPDGAVEIQSLRIGDSVETPIGPRPVTAIWETGYKDILSFTTEKGDLLSSHDHKIFTEEDGWIRADEIREGHTVFVHPMWNKAKRSVGQVEDVSTMFLGVKTSNRNSEMCDLRGTHNTSTEQFYCSKVKNYVQSKMLEPAYVGKYSTASRKSGTKYETTAAGKPITVQKTMGGHEIIQPNGQLINPENSFAKSTCHELSERQLRKEFNWRKWKRTDGSPTSIVERSIKRVGGRACNMGRGKRKKNRMANYDGGSCPCRKQMGSRIGRPIPQELNSKNPRPEKRQATDRGWMESSTVEERRSIGLPRARVLRVSKMSQQKCWDIEVADASCFFAEGVLVHNCKGAFTQNAQLLIAARSQGIPVHMLSATACQDPTEMRALGYALGLHSLNSPTDGLYSWQGWMRKFGCAMDIWNSWYLRDKEKLVDLHGVLYGAGGVAKRLSVADFPTSFRENRVHLLPLECAGSVNNIFKNAGIGHQQLVDYILESETPDEEIENQEPFIVRLLRARQEAELIKIPEMSTLADDYLDDGMAVICFVNFRETAHALAERLGCAIIEGGQSADQRQKIVDDFQAGLTHSLVVNIEAGGTGLSLHHQSACARPRVSLISPTYNAKTHLQVLGRTHRNGALSDSLQFVVLAADSVEETVAAAIDRKCKMLATLHGIEYQPLNQ
jgi:hypothetical protein